MKAPKTRIPRSRSKVIKGKKPPKSGVKTTPKTELQKMLDKWPPKF